MRDFLAATELRNDITELATLWKEVDNSIEELSNGATSQAPITKHVQSLRMHTKRFSNAARVANTKANIPMSPRIKLVINPARIIFGLSGPNVGREGFMTASNAIVTALNVAGPQRVVFGFAPEFLKQST